MKALCLTLLLVVAASAQIKKPEPPAIKPDFGTSLQAVVVVTEGWDTTQGRGRLFERKNVRSKWKSVGGEFRITVGRSGMGIDDSDRWNEDAANVVKKEGDGRSPAGLMPLTYAFGKADKANTKLKYLKVADFTECVDDVNSNHYNKIVNRMQVGAFDWKSSEKMLEIGRPYDLGIVVGYNSYPVEQGRGSCIFLHIWRDALTGTAGCTAMDRRDLERITAWLSPA